MKLKKGDRVWVRVPVNATVLRVNQRYGYTLQTDDKLEYSYFDDTEVSKISPRVIVKYNKKRK